MAGIQRRAIISVRNEERLMQARVKNVPGRSNRTALSNIANLQRNTLIGGKKNDNTVLETKLGNSKILDHAKSKASMRHNLHSKNSKDTMVVSEVTADEPMDDIINSLTELEVDDIDLDDFGNPTLCAEYVKDIYKYMKTLEQRLLPGDYMPRQSEITIKMRCILVDWLIQVQSRFNLLQETLYLTIYTLDRFLDKKNVVRSDLQLVGVTAMLLASKYEEMYAPEIGDFVYITDNAYSKDRIRTMEQDMLKVCEYDFSNPLSLHFLRRNSKAASVDAKKHTLAKYLMELTLVEYNFVQILPSKIAASSLYLALKVLDNSTWTRTLEHYSGYTEEELQSTVAAISALLLALDASKYQAVRNKYAASKFLRISRLPDLKGPIVRRFANFERSSLK